MTSREGGAGVPEDRGVGAPSEDRTATLEKVTLGYRPLPADKLPIVGTGAARADVYLAVMHSGVTMAPLMGRLAAIEILDGVRAEPLDRTGWRASSRPRMDAAPLRRGFLTQAALAVVAWATTGGGGGCAARAAQPRYTLVSFRGSERYVPALDSSTKGPTLTAEAQRDRHQRSAASRVYWPRRCWPVPSRRILSPATWRLNRAKSS